MNISLEGKKAIVTGGSRGIGREICLSLARAGASVGIMATRADLVSQVIAEIEKMGRKALPIIANVADENQVETAFKEAVEILGGLDILVNNAGITKDTLLLRMKAEDFDSVLDINLKGAFNCTKAALKGILRSSGCIINMSSVIGLMGNAGQANYAASKGGLIAFTKSISKEVARRGVRVNAIAPGFIASSMTEKLTDAQKNEILARIPAGTFGQPKDVAALVTFLASDYASYINGEVIRIDGGMAM